MTDPVDPRDALRPGERAVELPAAADVALRFIGRIRTPWTRRLDCPRQGALDGPECRIELFPPWTAALAGLDRYERVEVLYWLDRARRDLVLQSPQRDGTLTGTFALRSPVRPNPIGTALVRLISMDDTGLTVRGLDCLDGTPLVDLKPDRCSYSPQAVPKT